MFENVIDDIVAARKPKLCTVGRFMQTLEEADQAQLQRILDNEDLTGVEIADALRPHVKLTGQTVARHRRRGEGNGCSCP